MKTVFDKIDLERYSRQLPMLGASGQVELASSTVAVVGLGGLGSLVSYYLAAAGVGRLVVVDGERVELNNLNRQILYTTRDVGEWKADVAARRLGELNPDIEIVAHRQMVDGDNAEELLGEADVIVDGLDDWRARIVLDYYSQETGKPLVHGAVDGFYGQMTVIVPGKTPCLACLAPRDLGYRGCRAALGASVGLVAVLEALDTIKLLTKRGNPSIGRLLIVDALNTRIEEIPLKPVECQPCRERLLQQASTDSSTS
ncbi:MAG: HesA/MoeB/ThiF family protein [Desulfurococcales archaeon]|nr:HesA/MoeB/ThiF family protein [Desulfurococcales archaeon]